MNGALKQQINGNDKWCLTPITPVSDPNNSDQVSLVKQKDSKTLKAGKTGFPIRMVKAVVGKIRKVTSGVPRGKVA